MKLTRISLIFAATASVAAAYATPFRITITSLGPQPLSPTFMATTNNGFDLFTAGQAAPLRIEQIAEDGPTSQAVADATAAQMAGTILDFTVAPGGPIFPGQSRTVILEATMTHRWFQFASMLGMSNDAFIGSGLGLGDQQIDLYQGGRPLTADFTLSFVDVWDAGTEQNTELAAHLGAFGNPGVGPAENGVIRAPHSGLRGDGDLPLGLNWYGHNVARIEITPVPEPASLMALSIGALAMIRKRKK